MTTATFTSHTHATSLTVSYASLKANPHRFQALTQSAYTMPGSRLARGLKNLFARSLNSLPWRRDQRPAKTLSYDYDPEDKLFSVEKLSYENATFSIRRFPSTDTFSFKDMNSEILVTPFRVGPYLVSKKLGAGSFGSVHICKHIETGKTYAGKLFDTDFVQCESNMKMVFSEVAILKEVSHENTISFVDLVFSQYGVLLVMELVDGTELRDYAMTGRGIVESFARVVFEQLLKAIQHIHSLRIIHRDIKVENVMIDKRGTVKLIDYGLADKALEGRDGLTVNGYCGTRSYYSPELAQCEIDDGGKDDEFAGDKIDIWAAGVLLYMIVSGKEPFESKKDIRYEISQNNILWNVDFSPELRDLLQNILRTNPAERLSIEEILRHSWMKGEKLPSATKKAFRSKSGRIQVDFDEVVPKNAESCPQRFSLSEAEVHVARRAASMFNLVDWRKSVASNSLKYLMDPSEPSANAGQNVSFDFHYAETSESYEQKARKPHSGPSVRLRISDMTKLKRFIPSLLRWKPRGRQLTAEDIAQVWY